MSVPLDVVPPQTLTVGRATVRRSARRHLHMDDAGTRVIALVAVLLLAAWCLMWRLDRADWYYDEAVYARASWDSLHARGGEGHPLAAQYLMGLGQRVFGRDVVGFRLVPVLFSVAATGVVFSLGRRIAGWWSGIAAAALWAVLPRPLEIGGSLAGVVRADRYGFPDTISAFFSLAVLLAAWWWVERPSVRRACLIGVLVGLAVGSKVTGITVVPSVVLLAGLAVRPLSKAIGHLVVTGTVSLATFFVLYLPYGTDGPQVVWNMIDYQLGHASLGHVTIVNDHVWLRQPWWANMSFWLDSQGPALVMALVAAALAAWWARERLGVAFLWPAVLVPMALLSASPVALAHYWVGWFGPLALLAGIGTVAALQRKGGRALIGLAVAGVFVVAGVGAVISVVTMPLGDYGRMAVHVRSEAARPATAVVLGADLAPYFPGVQSHFATWAPDEFEADLVVIERRWAMQVGAWRVAQMRAQAEASDLVPAVTGDVEFWYRPR